MSQLANDLERFTDGLMAARRAKVALDIGDAGSPRFLTEKDIRDLRRLSLPSDPNQPCFKSQRLDAAFEVFRKTGSLTTSIEGLSFRTNARARVRQLTRRTTLYLILIVLTAIASLVFFWFQLRPGLQAIHQDIVATSGVDLPDHYDGLVVVVCLLLLALILGGLLWQLFGRTNWFTRFSGGDEYLQLGQQALVWSITKRLVEKGQPMSAATSTACQLLGLESSEPLLPSGAACESLHQASSAETLMEMLANQKIESVTTTFPTTAVVIVGGGCALVCSIVTFYPIIRLLDELSKVGV